MSNEQQPEPQNTWLLDTVLEATAESRNSYKNQLVQSLARIKQLEAQVKELTTEVEKLKSPKPEGE